MSDLNCRKCGEPYNTSHVNHDMTKADAARFRAGEGCEACEFGTKCVQCYGTGKEEEERSSCECNGDRFIMVRRLMNQPPPAFDDGGRWKQWAYNSMKWSMKWMDDEFVKGNTIKRLPEFTSREGRVAVRKVKCPHCYTEALDCEACGGSGKFNTSPMPPWASDFDDDDDECNRFNEVTK